jgi:hypothetical protein
MIVAVVVSVSDVFAFGGNVIVALALMFKFRVGAVCVVVAADVFLLWMTTVTPI